MAEKRNLDEVFRAQPDAYYIPISSSYIDDRVQILNFGDTFGVFNRFGDLQQLGNDVFGLYHGGTRFLRSFEMRVNGQRPLLLSSYIKDSNEVLSVDLINPDLYDNEVIAAEKGSIHIRRTKFIRHDVCYENIMFESFVSTQRRFEISFSVAADFRDIFEVRGIQRPKTGTNFGQKVLNERSIQLRYLGLDGIERFTDIEFSRKIDAVEDGKVSFNFAIDKNDGQYLTVETHFHLEKRSGNKLDFGAAHVHTRHSISQRNDQFASIETTNEQFNHWINRSKSDLVSLIADTDYGQYPFAGVPWYNTPFGRDGLITALQVLWVAPEIARGVLLYAANRQATSVDNFTDAQPGKIFHETRHGEMAALGEIPFKLYYGTIDATLLFICLAGNYYSRTGDMETIATIWPNIKAAINWMDEYGDINNDGFIEYINRSEKGLTNQGWKDSADSVSHADGTLANAPIALCEVQGYAYCARKQGAMLARCFGEHELAAHLSDSAEKLAQAFNENFWDEKLGIAVIALDGDKKPCRIKTSNAGHCLYSGIVNKENAKTLVRTLFAEDMFSGWGVRTLSSLASRYNPMSYHNGSIWPHDNSLIALGLSDYGFKNEAMMIMQGLFDASLYFTNQRLPELFCGFARREGEGPTHYPVACSPQAWAVASTFACIQAAIGIEVDAISRSVKFHQPSLPPYIDALAIRGLRLGTERCNVFLNRYEDDIGISVKDKPENWSVIVTK